MANENVTQSEVGLPAGTKIGKYEIGQRLKIGGQAIIYKAHDSLLGRDVAIKQISTHLAEDAAFLERFRREAQILARLGQEQPAIVTIHELIEEERGLFIVMEFVPGNNLETILEENSGPIETKAALQVIFRLAGALHSVHAAGIIHRDIKPANIMISEGLRVKIADFGVAASMSGQTSMVLGTTKYMAPELFTGEGSVDGRVDMYSLGFIAYEMLIGREKFREVFSEVVRDPHTESFRWMKWHSDKHVQAPLLNEVNPAVPPALAQIVAKMMVKDPDERYESMEALGRDIKGQFSPRMRAESGAPAGTAVAAPAAGAAPPVAQPVEDEGHPTSPGEAPTGQKADVSEEPSPGGPATAALPKRVIPLKKKLIIAGAAFGVVLVIVLGLWIYGNVQRGKVLTASQRAFKQAEDLFKEGRDYSKAQEAFEGVMAGFPGTPEAVKASVILRLCKAYKAVDEYDWQGAQEHEKATRERLNDVQGFAVAKSPLYMWTQEFKDDIDKFKDYYLVAWGFREKFTRAKKLLAKGDYEKALDEVKKYFSPGALPVAAFRKELAVFKAEVELARFRFDSKSEIDKGDDHVAKGNLDEAKQAYLGAKALLESKQGLVLPKKERDDLLKGLAAKLKTVDTRKRYEDAIAVAEEARKDGDKAGEKVALELVQEIKPSAEVAARIKSLRVEMDMARAHDAIDKDKDPKNAIKILKEILAYDPNNSDAKALLKGLERRDNWLAVLSQAHKLYRKGDYPAALVEYEKAAALLAPDATVKERMVDCRYRIKMKEADQLRNADKLPEAIKAYEEALIIRPEKAAKISALQELCLRVLQYRAHRDAGDTAQKNKNWKVALDEYMKAQRIKNTQEINDRISVTKYSRFLALGKASLDDGDPKSAIAYFNRAKAIMDTEEVRKLIDHAKKLLNE